MISWLRRRNKNADGKIVLVAVDTIELNPFELRKIRESQNEEEFRQLVRSIEHYGLFQPIVLRPHPAKKMNSKYQVIAGGRRFRATKAAHLTKVPAIIKTASDKEMRKLALMENILRREMKDYEKAHALKSIYEAHGFDLESAIKHINAIENFRRNGESVLNIPSDILQLCSDIGYSPRTQRRYLKLLSDLKPRVFEYTEKMKLQTEKKEMLARKALRGDAKLQKVLANIIKDIPAREARQIVRSIETGSYIFTGKGFEIAEGKSGGVEDTEPSEFNKRSICNISQDIKPCKRHVESNNWNEKKNIFN